MKKNRKMLGKDSAIKRILGKREVGILIPLIVVFVVSGLVNPLFFGYQNITNILFQSSFVFIIGIITTYVFILGCMDLSVGSVLGLSGVVTGLALVAGLPVWLSIIFGIMAGGAVGLFNGFIIAKFNIPTLIVTLSTMYIARGLCEFFTRGNPVYPLPANFNILGQGKLMLSESFGIPWPVIFALVLGIIGHIILTQTTFGRAVFAIGGNKETARLSGIKVKRTTMIVYTLSGMAAGMSGILMASRLGSALSNSGMGWELNVIASVIIGGTSMFGGAGSILGSAIGAVLMTTVTNGMAMLKVSVYLQKVVIGVVILIAVGIDQYNRKRSGMKE
ncbi:MAG: ABC transporter permease [Clostridia bacterium]|nr:ABC transporter permease [Clostridia bacterium]